MTQLKRWEYEAVRDGWLAVPFKDRGPRSERKFDMWNLGWLVASSHDYREDTTERDLIESLRRRNYTYNRRFSKNAPNGMTRSDSKFL